MFARRAGRKSPRPLQETARIQREDGSRGRASSSAASRLPTPTDTYRMRAARARAERRTGMCRNLRVQWPKKTRLMNPSGRLNVGGDVRTCGFSCAPPFLDLLRPHGRSLGREARTVDKTVSTFGKGCRVSMLPRPSRQRWGRGLPGTAAPPLCFLLQAQGRRNARAGRPALPRVAAPAERIHVRERKPRLPLRRGVDVVDGEILGRAADRAPRLRLELARCESPPPPRRSRAPPSSARRAPGASPRTSRSVSPAFSPRSPGTVSEPRADP